VIGRRRAERLIGAVTGRVGVLIGHQIGGCVSGVSGVVSVIAGMIVLAVGGPFGHGGVEVEVRRALGGLGHDAFGL